MFENLKERVLEANLLLNKTGLVVLTWGNVSEIDRQNGVIAIKPSGVPYEELTIDKIVLVDLNGKVIEGDLAPSSDLMTHLAIYIKHPEVGGVAHTHSTYSVAYAQAGRSIKVLGTTHADTFLHDIPCTRNLTLDEIEKDYELNTGKVINEFLDDNALNCPAVLVKNHGPFVVAENAIKAVQNCLILETIAKMNLLTEILNKDVKPLNKNLLDKHYYRKHGPNAYYGQGDK